jgi:hypothetical protein
MEIKFQRPKERDGVLSSLNAAIEILNLAKELSSISSATAAFGSVNALLMMIRVNFRLFRHDHVFQAHKNLGLNDQRTGLC